MKTRVHEDRRGVPNLCGRTAWAIVPAERMSEAATQRSRALIGSTASRAEPGQIRKFDGTARIAGGHFPWALLERNLRDGKVLWTHACLRI